VSLATGTKVAVGALKGLLSSVHQQVCRQVALLAGTIVAVGALKGLLSSVHQQVCRQVTLVAGTIVAWVLSFPLASKSSPFVLCS
jgi:hypothetical protein